MILLPDCRVRWVQRFFDDQVNVAAIKANFKACFNEQYPPITTTPDATPTPKDGPDLHRQRDTHRPGFGNDFYNAPEILAYQDEVREFLNGRIEPLKVIHF